MRLAALALVLAACDDRAAPAIVARPGDAAVPVAPAITAPHGSEIAIVAITDDAHAAITADDNGDLRFWPALDGTREPVVIRGPAPRDLALARAADGFVVALLDAASGLEVVHLAADGAERDRRLVPAEPGFVEVAATATVLLGRRADQAIVRLDTAKVLAPAPGQQILAIAARGDDAIAAIADPARLGEILEVRELDLGGLAWGRVHQLPVPLRAPIALSPSGRRLAGHHARTSVGVVIELGATPRVVASDVVGIEPGAPTVGFLDDGHVVFRGGIVVTVPRVPVIADPWTGTRSHGRVRLGRDAAIADGLAVGGVGTHLLIAGGSQTRFLGYRDLGEGHLRVNGSQITVGFGTRVVWLDSQLRERRSSDSIGGFALDERHLLRSTYAYHPAGRSDFILSLFDAVTGKDTGLGSYPQATGVAYEPDTGVYAVFGAAPEVARARLDIAARTTSPMHSLKARAGATIELVDPAAAAGTVAIAYQQADDGVHVETFVDDGLHARAALAPASTVMVRHAVLAIGTDRTGTMYTLAARPDATLILAHRGGKEVRRIAVEREATLAAVDRAGTMLAAASRTHVMRYDMDGRERWRVPAWSVTIARFTADGGTLLVNTQGGLMALDTLTGARRAAGCGWGFGLSTAEPPLTVFSAPVVCAEAP